MLLLLIFSLLRLSTAYDTSTISIINNIYTYQCGATVPAYFTVQDSIVSARVQLYGTGPGNTPYVIGYYDHVGGDAGAEKFYVPYNYTGPASLQVVNQDTQDILAQVSLTIVAYAEIRTPLPGATMFYYYGVAQLAPIPLEVWCGGVQGTYNSGFSITGSYSVPEWNVSNVSITLAYIEAVGLFISYPGLTMAPPATFNQYTGPLTIIVNLPDLGVTLSTNINLVVQSARYPLLVQ